MRDEKICCSRTLNDVCGKPAFVVSTCKDNIGGPEYDERYPLCEEHFRRLLETFYGDRTRELEFVDPVEATNFQLDGLKSRFLKVVIK